MNALQRFANENTRLFIENNLRNYLPERAQCCVNVYSFGSGFSMTINWHVNGAKLSYVFEGDTDLIHIKDYYLQIANEAKEFFANEIIHVMGWPE